MRDLTDIRNEILKLPCYQNSQSEVIIVSCRCLGQDNQYLNIIVAVPAKAQTSRKTTTCLYMKDIKIFAELQRQEHCKIAKLVSGLLNQYSRTCIEFHDLGSTISYLVG